MRGAVSRVILAFGLPAACLYGALGYEQVAQWLGPTIGLSSSGHFPGSMFLAIMLSIVAGVIWCSYQIFTDADDKWRRLHWFYFGLFALILFCCYGPMLLLVAIAGLHFAFHWSIHAAFHARDLEVNRSDND